MCGHCGLEVFFLSDFLNLMKRTISGGRRGFSELGGSEKEWIEMGDEEDF